MKKKFTFLMAALMLLTMMVLPWKAVGQDTYSKVTSVSGINTTDTYIIVCEDSNVAMKVYSSGDNNHKTVSANINNGSASSVGNDVCLLTLESTGTANQYYLKNQNNQYLLAVSGQNYLKAQTSKADACKFTLSYSDEVLTITSTVAPKSGSWNPSRMRYNSSSSCFACYGTGQNAIAIYKKNLPKLATPTNFHATAGDEQAEFSWNAVEHAISYTIAYTPAGGTEQTITDITGTSRIITGLTNDLEYSCKIKAVGDGTSYSDSDYSSTISVTPTGSTTFTVTYDANGATSGEVPTGCI